MDDAKAKGQITGPLVALWAEAPRQSFNQCHQLKTPAAIVGSNCCQVIGTQDTGDAMRIAIE